MLAGPFFFFIDTKFSVPSPGFYWPSDLVATAVAVTQEPSKIMRCRNEIVESLAHDVKLKLQYLTASSGGHFKGVRNGGFGKLRRSSLV